MPHYSWSGIRQKERQLTKKLISTIAAFSVVVLLAAPAARAADDLAARLQSVLSNGPETKFWQVSADEVQEMIAAKKTDFVVVDVRPSPTEFSEGHVPGAIQIQVQDMFKPESLKKLPKNKKLILMCGTGQVQNLPVLGLRALGYDAYLMAFGFTNPGPRGIAEDNGCRT